MENGLEETTEEVVRRVTVLLCLLRGEMDGGSGNGNKENPDLFWKCIRKHLRRS